MSKLLIIALACSMLEAVEYSKLYETIDLDGILKNGRILDNYVNCFTEKGPCTAEAREFKVDIPRGILNACKDCSETQKTIVRKAGRFMKEKRPDALKKILDFFDPDGTTSIIFFKFLEEKDIKSPK